VRTRKECGLRVREGLGAGGGRPRIKSLAFSAIKTTAALVLPPMMNGNTEASTTRKVIETDDAQLRVHHRAGIAAHAAGAHG